MRKILIALVVALSLLAACSNESSEKDMPQKDCTHQIDIRDKLRPVETAKDARRFVYTVGRSYRLDCAVSDQLEYECLEKAAFANLENTTECTGY